jgi:hypothetical protein
LPLPEKVATVASLLSAKNLSHSVDLMVETVDAAETSFSSSIRQ